MLVLGTSFVQRKTPAVTGVVKAGGEGTVGGSGGKEGGSEIGSLGGICLRSS